MWTRKILMRSKLVNFRTLSDKFIKLVNNIEGGSPYAITETQKQYITGGDSETTQKLENLLMYLSLKQERGDTLPKSISVLEVFDLLSLSTTEVERKLQIYLTRHKPIAKRWMEKDGSPSYERKNTFFLPIMKTSQSCFYNINLEKGRIFGQQVVFDCAYDDYMNIAQLRETAKNLNSCIHINQKNSRPFGLNFCNVDRNSKVMHHFKYENGAIEFLPINIYQCSYLDLFRKEDIVYVSPHVNQELEYHPDDIYVIGALSRTEEKLSLKKARNEGIRCARLPLSFTQMRRRKYIPSVWEMFESLLIKKNVQ